MKHIHRLAIGLTLIGVLSATAGAQQLPGAHPAYLHALSDLRAARALLYRQPGDSKVYADEDFAIHEIDAAIGELKQAAIDDGKNIDDHPKVDVQEHGSRLLKAIEMLKTAHADVEREEDNPLLQGLKHRIVDHIGHAIQGAGKAHTEWLNEKR